jgi:acyl carrier protein
MSDTVSVPVAERTAQVRGRIRELLVDLFNGDRFVRGIADDVSLREAGVPSTSLVSLLVAMEDAFGFEWDDDVQPEVLRSIDSLAGHVVALRG